MYIPFSFYENTFNALGSSIISILSISNLFEEFLLDIFSFAVILAHEIRILLFILGMIMILYSLKLK